jgi:hypothetical protein
MNSLPPDHPPRPDWRRIDTLLSELDLEGASPTRRAARTRLFRWIRKMEAPTVTIGRLRLIDANFVRRALHQRPCPPGGLRTTTS